MKPHWIYVFGPIGGAFKVGYTSNVKTRTNDLRCNAVCALRGHSFKDAEMRHLESIFGRELAKKAERLSHHALSPHRLNDPKKDYWQQEREWFRAELPLIISVVQKAVEEVTAACPP